MMLENNKFSSDQRKYISLGTQISVWNVHLQYIIEVKNVQGQN